MEPFMPQPTVLVVDDEESTREILCDILKDEGFIVHTASNGREALNHLTASADLVIMDMCMPGISGAETCREMMRHTATRNIPVLMLSGCNRESLLDVALNAGALDFVEKPVRCTELRAKAGAALMLPRIGDIDFKRRLFLELVETETRRLEQEDTERPSCFESMCAL